MVDRVELPASVRDGRGDAGAVLILALAFLLVVSVIVGALVSWVGSDLSNTAHFTSERSQQYAADSATEVAIQNIRYSPQISANETLNASPPTYCYGSAGNPPTLTVDGQDMAVWCSTQWNPGSGNTRVVTLSTCLNTVLPASCASSPLLQAVVTFDDYPGGGVSAPSPGICVVYCGTNITVNSWTFVPVVPTLGTVSPTTGPITGGTSVTLTGTGFVTGSTVNFVEESGGSPTSDNVVLPATNVTVVSSTSITANAPSVTEGTTYYVTVTTPTGTSPYSAIFTYSTVAPSASAVTPNSGSTAGGTGITISGSGFVTGAAVIFTEESNGSAVSPSVVVPAPDVTVVSDSVITAVSPAVTAGTTYFVTVSTPTGTSAYGPVFTVSAPVPIAAAISPTFGPSAGGTTVTITGTGFVTGATVSFTEESSGSVVSPNVVLAGTSVNVTGPTTITATAPVITAGTTYYVTVTTPAGTSNDYPVFTYSS